MTVPFVDLHAQHAEIAGQVEAGMARVFERTAFVGAQEVGEFEGEYADFIGARHCVGVANGTDALELAFRAVGVRPGGEVIIPANTFIATAEAVSRLGATPVLVDVEDDYLLMNPVGVEEAITGRTQAIAPVHLFGQMADLESICTIADRHGVPVVEDAAQAQGARRNGRAAGAIGLAAGTSFYPGKNLGAAGDAGAVTTNDDDVASMVRLVGAHGSAVRYVHEVVGVNSRLDSLQAVYLSAKLRRLEKWNAARRIAADRYEELLAGVNAVRTPATDPVNEHVWHLYVVRVAERDRILAGLGDAGIGAGIHYPHPVHLTPAYAHLGMGAGSYPVAERAAMEILSLPMFPHLREDQQRRVVDVLADLVSHTAA